MKNLKITLIMIALIAFATTTLAITVEEVANSPLDNQQKMAVAMQIANGDTAQASVNFVSLMKTYEETINIQKAATYVARLEAEIKADAEAELAKEQAEIKAELNNLLTPIPTMEKVWPAAQAFADSNTNHKELISSTMALRYKLKGDYLTIESVKIAHEARAELKATILSITDPGRKLMATGLKVHNGLFEMMLAQQDTMNRRLVVLEGEVDKLTTLQNDQDGDIEALKAFIIMVDSNNEVNEASQRRFQQAQRAQKND